MTCRSVALSSCRGLAGSGTRLGAALILFLSWTASAGSADYRYLHVDVFTDRPLSGNQLAVFLEPGLPTFAKTIDDTAAVAATLGVAPDDVLAELPVQEVSCGAPFLMVPLTSRRAVDESRLDRAGMGALLDARDMTKRGVFVFALEPSGDDATLYSRMFGFGVVEDPATGNASGPVGSYLVHHGVLSPDEAQHIVSRQGWRWAGRAEFISASTRVRRVSPRSVSAAVRWSSGRGRFDLRGRAAGP